MQVLSKESDSLVLPAVVTVGKFDGFHAGHRTLLAVVLREMREDMVSCVLSISEDENTAGKQLYTKKEQQYLCAGMGFDYLAEYTLDDAMKALTPEEFVRDYLVTKLNAKTVVVGEDFYFGRGRSGDTEVLGKLGEKYGFRTVIVSLVESGGSRVSSTRIRECLKKGQVEEANFLLRRQFMIMGEIVHGNHLGETIGFPTINIVPPAEKFLPPFGVYITKVRVEGMWYYGITNVGLRPTVNSGTEGITVETHLLYCNRNLYGATAEVYFLSFLRNEKKFSDIKELSDALEQDKAYAENYCKGLNI